MRDCSGPTAALLANPPPGLKAVDLYTVKLADGVTVYRWTSYDRDLTVNGNVYSSRKPWLQRSRWSVANTMQVPTLEILLKALNDGFAGGIDIKGQLTNGLFDGTTVTLDRVWFEAGTTVINDVTTSTGGDGSGGVSAGLLGVACSPGQTVVVDWWQNTFNQSSTNDQAQMGIAFLDSSATEIGSPTLAGYTAPVGWTERSLSVVAPAGTVAVRLYQQRHRRAGSNNDGYIDTITLSIDGVPIPIYNGDAEQGVAGWEVVTGQLVQRSVDPLPHSGLLYWYGGTAADCSAYYPSADAPATSSHPGVRLFGGNVANVEISGNEAILYVKGKTNLLDQYAPRNLYQLGCQHAFCDAGCTLSRVTFTASYTVGSSPSRTFIPWSGSAPANASNYRFGTVKFTSGACAGQSRTVRLGDSTGLTLTQPLIGTPSAGDSFTAFEGCDKQLSSGSGQDCTARSDTQNWRAFPFVPPADSAA